MVLQYIVWPTSLKTQIEELYYHVSFEPDITIDGLLKIPSKSFISFNTYFNMFSGKTWIKYTIIKKCIFRLIVDGRGTVYLKKEDGCIIAKQKFCGKEEIKIVLNEIEPVFYYIKIKADESVTILFGSVETEQEGREIRIALATCTYNRKEMLYKNIRFLREKNNKLVDNERVLDEIYIVDNASNINSSEVECEWIKLIPNRNTGGAGGFTRGLQEAMKNINITHIILMDDDVDIEFESMVRTKSVLRYIKGEYEDNFIGGAMFRKDKPYVLHAAGEDWADGLIINPYKSTDMRESVAVQKISELVKSNQVYAGWWYCCIPRKHVEKKGYPIPFFLHCDDVEYSLRSGKTPIYLNGIAVWHEEFENKRNSIMEYYDVRNRLITNALYKEHGKLYDAIYILCERFYANVFRYRYEDFLLSVKAAEDFLKGPEWQKSVDAEVLHKELSVYGYYMDDVQEIPEKEKYSIKNKLFIIGRYFFIAKGRDVIQIGAPVSAYVGKKELLLVEPKSKKGFVVRKSWKKTLCCIGWLFTILLKLLLRYYNKANSWCLGRKKNNASF